MNPAIIFLPVVTLAALTLLVAGMVGFQRLGAAFRGRVKADDFKYGESANVPPDVSLPNRNMMNLLELPVLFYVACVVLYVLGTVGRYDLWLAWAYVALRVVHSLIHLTYNKPQHRLVPFSISNFALVAIWVHILQVVLRRVS